jgi:L-ascorbate metabolism protein UlaG (beta-lactamase superfamily)
VDEKVVFQWLGTAGFRIEHAGKVILIDPYLTRNEKAMPVLDLKPEDMADANYIFISHGHFDHLVDVPEILDASQASVYCSEVAGATLEQKGVSGSRIKRSQGGSSFDLDTFGVAVASSKHIRFDARLILSTMPRIIKDRKAVRALGRWPAGPVLIHSFDFGGLRVVHLGSLGVTPEEAKGLGLGEPRPDILMPPLQGHTDICRRAALVTAAIRPRAVVPQHHDDFFPPVSQMIDLGPFRRMVSEMLPGCSYYEPEMNRKFTAEDVFKGS